MNHPIFIIAGAAIMDVLARPVNPSVFRTGSIPAKGITMHTGGDAMNEAKALSCSWQSGPSDQQDWPGHRRGYDHDGMLHVPY